MDFNLHKLPFYQMLFYGRMLRNFEVSKNLMTLNDLDLNDPTTQESGH